MLEYDAASHSSLHGELLEMLSPCLACALQKGAVCPLKGEAVSDDDMAAGLCAVTGALCLLPWLHVWLCMES